MVFSKIFAYSRFKSLPWFRLILFHCGFISYSLILLSIFLFFIVLYFVFSLVAARLLVLPPFSSAANNIVLFRKFHLSLIFVCSCCFITFFSKLHCYWHVFSVFLPSLLSLHIFYQIVVITDFHINSTNSISETKKIDCKLQNC